MVEIRDLKTNSLGGTLVAGAAAAASQQERLSA
jgi:hypothetical protein